MFQRPRPQPADPGLVHLQNAYEARDFQVIRRELMEDAYGVRPIRVQVNSRWKPSDADSIMGDCEAGDFFRLGLFLDSMRRDGLISGIMGTRTAGMLRLPVAFTGDPFLSEQLRGVDPEYDADTYEPLSQGITGAFSRMFPNEELSEFLWDGIMAGFAVGEMVPDPHGGLPRLRHLDLHWLRYIYDRDEWVYQSPAGTWLVRPGDGRWVLFTPRGRHRPWIKGSWWACALPFISKIGTAYDRLRWQGQLADALRVIQTNDKSTEHHRDEYRRFLRDGWFRSPGIVVREGEDAKLVESNGRGYQVYLDSEASANKAITIALAGTEAIISGTTGFSKGSIFENIKLDLIAEFAEGISNCLHDQGTNWWAQRVWSRPNNVWAKWDVRSPEQKVADAEAIGKLSESVQKADEMLAPRGLQVDIDSLIEQQGFSLPTKPLHPELPSSAQQELLQ